MSAVFIVANIKAWCLKLHSPFIVVEIIDLEQSGPKDRLTSEYRNEENSANIKIEAYLSSIFPIILSLIRKSYKCIIFCF